MTATLVEDLDLIVTADAACRVLRHTSVLVDRGRIAAIGSPRDDPGMAMRADGAARVDGRGRLMLPGLVNLHTHTPMTLLRGLAEEVDLQDFLSRVWAAEGAVMDPASVELGARLGALESLRSGSTTTLDMYFHHVDAHRGAVAVGTRHVTGPVFFDFPGPDERSWDQRMTGLAAWPHERDVLGGPMTPLAACPHGTYTVSPGHLRDIASVARGWQRPLVTTHASENLGENDEVRARYDRTPTEVLAEVGLLDGSLSVVVGHGVHLTEGDQGLLSAARAAVAHCPGSNLKLASGALPWHATRAAGVRLGLGTDGCSSSNDLDMWTVMRLAALLARLTSGRPDTTPAADIVRAATIEGARALGLGDQIGSIEVGKEADLVLLDLDAPHLTPVHDPHALLVFAAGRGDVCDVFVAGEHVVRDRHSTRVDEAELLARCRERGLAAAAAAAAAAESG